MYVDGTAFLAQGVLASVRRHTEAMVSLIVPMTAARSLFHRRFDSDSPPQLIVATLPGYANAVAGALPGAVSPVSPSAITVSTPQDLDLLRAKIAGDISGLLTILGIAGLTIGVVGIANTTLVSVLERVHEIGLRRALGARRSQIALQFLLESFILGTIGGVLGAAIGLIAITIVALVNNWVPTLPIWIVLSPLSWAALLGCSPARTPRRGQHASTQSERSTDRDITARYSTAEP